MTAFERWSIWISSVLVTATGLVYGWMKYLLPEPAGFSIVRHPLQPLFLKLHVLTAPVLVFALGSVAVRHIWRHLVTGTRQGRVSGWSAALTTIPMVLTGYFLQVFVSESLLRSLALAHIATGIVFGGGLLLHQVMVRRIQRVSYRSNPAAPSDP
jgi:undecaprenyl pyrophosphate phosphatase UppP